MPKQSRNPVSQAQNRLGKNIHARVSMSDNGTGQSDPKNACYKSTDHRSLHRLLITPVPTFCIDLCQCCSAFMFRFKQHGQGPRQVSSVGTSALFGRALAVFGPRQAAFVMSPPLAFGNSNSPFGLSDVIGWGEFHVATNRLFFQPVLVEAGRVIAVPPAPAICGSADLSARVGAGDTAPG